jgi:hypothetical protein
MPDRRAASKSAREVASRSERRVFARLSRRLHSYRHGPPKAAWRAWSAYLYGARCTKNVLDAADLPAIRAARDAVIDTARPPASTAVQVAALFAPGYLLELEAWALVGD